MNGRKAHQPATAANPSPSLQPGDPWEALDASRDWRAHGPFDVTEVEPGDLADRVDLAALIVTAEAGLDLQIVAEQATGRGIAVVFAIGDSALQVTVFAAPNSGGLAAETRRDLMADAEGRGGRAELVEGPFGTELRRWLADEQGAKGRGVAYRDWYAEGPRWLLLGRLTGPAALAESAAEETFVRIFRNLVVRRPAGAMVPGTFIPLTIPGAGGG